VKERYLLNYPVVIVDVMPKAAATNQVMALFGDLRQAATMGIHREGVRIEASNSAYVGSESCFERDKTAIRGIERMDVVAHDVGSSTSCGPICGIISHTA
jgi:HK97 family phage major capsid protein